MPSYIGFIPTPPECVDGFFDLVTPGPSDVVYDLGSGDGRLLFAALKKGAGKVVGVDLNPELVQQAKETARLGGLQDRATFIQGDVMDVDLSDATMVFFYLFPTASEALKPKLEKELKPGSIVVIESFYIDEWQHIKSIDKGGKSFFLYKMPAQHREKFVF